MGSMKFLVVLALFAMAMAEPEADPALIYTTNTLPLTSGVHSPLVYNSAVQTPLVYNSAVQTPLVNTFYNYPNVYHYGKREAEPEADPALIYATNTLPLTTAVHSPLVYKTLPVDEKVSTPLVYTHGFPVHQPVVYKTLPVDEKTEKVSTPLVYTHGLPLHQPVVYNTPFQTPLVYNPAVQSPLVFKTPLVNTVYNTALTNPLLSKVFPSLKTITTPVVSHITKREAEADPALLYPTGVQTPLAYNTAVQTPLVYNINTAVQTPLLKTG